jgi:hypothetical protein
MSKVVYRGVTYNAEEQKEIFRAWWNSVHSIGKKFTYRGTEYDSSDVGGCSLVSK